MKIKLITLLLACLLGCVHTQAQSSTYAGKSSYEERFDPWRACNLALEPASHGDRDAQIAMFLSAYVRLSQPYTGGEDLGQMRENFKQLLATLNDDGFYRALQQQRPEVRSAVRWFVDMKDIQGKYPRTYHLLKDSPKIDWPTVKAYRDH